MTKVNIKIISSLHVGSGNVLFHGNDFVGGIDAEGFEVIGIVDMRKAMNLIGEDNIGAWTAAIDRGKTFDEVIKRYSPRATVADYSSRLVDVQYDMEANKNIDLREFIHDGLGRPYIPGSSIKGAIRSSVLSALAAKLPLAALVVKGKNGRVSGSEMEKKLLGNEPSSDIFRFVHVGDAIFDGWHTSAMLTILLNERKIGDVLDKSKKQLIETLPAGCETTMDLDIDARGFQLFCKDQHCVSDLSFLSGDVKQLFSIVNDHTKQLVDEEIGLWHEKEDSCKDENGVLPDYIDELNRIKVDVEKCTDGKSCILRIGFGSGWRFITGAWTERFKGTAKFDDVVNASRPKNFKYDGYDFPKSRKVEYETCEPFGFVKLSLA